MSTVHYLSAARPSPVFEHVVALHCSGSSGRQWDPYAERLPAGMRLTAPDLMGSGRENAWTPGAPVTLEAEARRVLAAFPGDGAPVHLIGHSYGGAVALEIAMRWPEKVRTLTLYEPVRFALLDNAGAAGIRQSIIETGTRIVQLVELGPPARQRRHVRRLLVRTGDLGQGAGTAPASVRRSNAESRR